MVEIFSGYSIKDIKAEITAFLSSDKTVTAATTNTETSGAGRVLYTVTIVYTPKV